MNVTAMCSTRSRYNECNCNVQHKLTSFPGCSDITLANKFAIVQVHGLEKEQVVSEMVADVEHCKEVLL